MMKKFLTKTLLVAVCLLGGANSVWAGGVTDLGNGTSRLGNEDNTTAWWTDFTDWYTIAPNKTLTLTFVNHSSKAENFANWAVEIDNNAVNYEWLLMRSDCFGITNGEWTGRTTNDNSTGWFKYNLNNYDWSSNEVFRNNLDGATVVMTIKRIGSELYLIEDVTTAGVEPKSFRHYFVMDCAADKDNNLKARLTVDRAHLIINNSAPVTDSQTLPTITGTLHGLIDQKGVFGWGTHEDFTLSANSTLKLNFINYSSKGENWFNWILEIQEGSNYLDLRCDDWGWGTYWDTKKSCDQTSGYLDNFQNKMDGATVNMTIERSGANLTITAVHTPKTGDAFTQTFTHESFPAEGDVVVRLLTENACLDLLPVTVPISSYGWATFSSDYALDFSKATEGLEAYMITGHEGTVVTKAQVTGTVPARTGLLLKGAEGSYNIPIVGSSDTDISANKLVAGTGASVSAESGKTKYVLGVSASSEAEFQKIDGTPATVATGKAYLEFNGVISARAMSFEGDEITGIENVVAAPAEATLMEGKFIENGKLVIVKNGMKFNAAGQQMK